MEAATLAGEEHRVGLGRFHELPILVTTLSGWLMAAGLAAFTAVGYPIVSPSDRPSLKPGQSEMLQIQIVFIIGAMVLTSTARRGRRTRP